MKCSRAARRAQPARAAKALAAATVANSVCAYCAVGCGQNVYVQDGRGTQIDGDPDWPISRWRPCPKGAASK